MAAREQGKNEQEYGGASVVQPNAGLQQIPRASSAQSVFVVRQGQQGQLERSRHGGGLAQQAAIIAQQAAKLAQNAIAMAQQAAELARLARQTHAMAENVARLTNLGRRVPPSPSTVGSFGGDFSPSAHSSGPRESTEPQQPTKKRSLGPDEDDDMERNRSEKRRGQDRSILLGSRPPVTSGPDEAHQDSLAIPDEVQNGRESEQRNLKVEVHMGLENPGSGIRREAKEIPIAPSPMPARRRSPQVDLDLSGYQMQLLHFEEANRRRAEAEAEERSQF